MKTCVENGAGVVFVQLLLFFFGLEPVLVAARFIQESWYETGYGEIYYVKFYCGKIYCANVVWPSTLIFEGAR